MYLIKWTWVPIFLILVGCGQGTETGGVEPVTRVARAELRAFHGAPPVIPHGVRSEGRENCLACHGEGMQADGRIVAAVTPHSTWFNCTQCHVEPLTEALFVANTLTGLAEPEIVAMPQPFLPRYIPHRLDNYREQACETCHIGTQAAINLRPGHGVESHFI